MNLLPEVIAWHQAGATPIPVRADGTKAPAVKTWRQWEHAQPPLAELLDAFGQVDTDGLGLICGAASGNLEMIELEGRAVAEGWLQQLEAAFDAHGPQWRAVWDRIAAGYVEQTPSGGIHWHYRVTDGPAAKNTKLASRPARAEDGTKARVVVMIETRGQGGFTVVAPSGGRTHKSGQAWTVLAGSRNGIPALSVEERDGVHAIASTLDLTPEQEWSGQANPSAPPAPRRADVPAIPSHPDEPPPGIDLKPGEDFNARGTWDFLAAAGWQRGRTGPSGRTAWTRPGKNPLDGISATTGGAEDGQDRLYVFTSSSTFDTERPYTRFGAYTWLCHGGDFAAAARQLRAEGYGSDDLGAGLTMASVANTIPGQVAPDAASGADPAASLLDRLTREEVLKLQARQAARAIVAELTAPPAEPFDLDTLAGVLSRPAEPPMRIDRLLPWAAAMLLIAQRKTGKTTMELNLARSLLTGQDFLGSFAVRPVSGTIALLNYEVSAQQIATWANEHDVDPDRLILVNLRGRRNPLSDPADAARLATELRARDVETVIVDPFGRAYTGVSQNDAGEVGAWLQSLDRFVRAEVGALDLILTAHAGWNGERTRGSSALEDWADVLVNITREESNDDDDSARYFKAEGRDVDIPEDRLLFHDKTRTLTLARSGGRKKDRQNKKAEGLAGPALELITASPGITYKDLLRRLRDAVGGVRDADASAAVKYLIDTGRAHRKDAPTGHPKPLYPGQQALTFGVES